MLLRSWWLSVLRMGQAGIQALLKVSLFAHRQNKCIQTSRITELLRLEGTSGEHLVFGGSYALFMEKEHLSSLVLQKANLLGAETQIHLSSLYFTNNILTYSLCISRNAKKLFLGNDAERKINANKTRQIINKSNIIPMTCRTLISAASPTL